MVQAFNASSEQQTCIEEWRGMFDHVTVIDVPDTTGVDNNISDPVNPISGRTRRDIPSYNNSPFKPTGSNVYSRNNNNMKEVPSFAIANSEDRLKGLGGINSEIGGGGSRYDQLDPERDIEHADTNMSPNATEGWSAVHSSVDGSTNYKRRIPGLV